MLETEFISSSEDEILGAPTAESDELEALYAARDAEVEAATRAHLAQFKKWIVEDEPEPPELLCARIDAHDYTPPLYVQPDRTFDAAAMVQHYLNQRKQKRRCEELGGPPFRMVEWNLIMYVYDLDRLRSGLTVRYAIRFDTPPSTLKVMRDANLVTL